MLRYIFSFIVLFHGLIHIMGFVKAFEIAPLAQFRNEISKAMGSMWLLTALLFILVSALMVAQKNYWWTFAMVAVMISQCLIAVSWADARFGTIVNVIILFVCMLSFGSWRFEQAYQRDVAGTLKRAPHKNEKLISSGDIARLPGCVQSYLKYSGVLNKPEVTNFRIVFLGQMRAKGKEWFHFTSQQFNSIYPITRLFFMKARMYGVSVPGYHAYKNGNASMVIKPFGWIKVVDEKGPLLDKAETVTFFNDMCLFAPAMLIDKRIVWREIDSLTVSTTFTVEKISVTATLYFNDQGQLINFESTDRVDIGDNQQYLFSTPVSNYKMINGYRLPEYGEAIWHYPDGPFIYGKFHLKEIAYNVASSP